MFAKIFAAAVLTLSFSSGSALAGDYAAMPESYYANYILSPDPTSDLKNFEGDACHVEDGEPVGCEIFEISETCNVDNGMFFVCSTVDHRNGQDTTISSYGGQYACPFKKELDFNACWRKGFGQMADVKRLLETGRDSSRLDAIIAMDMMKVDAESFLSKRLEGEAEEKRMMFFREYFFLKDKVNGTKTYSDIGEMKRSFGLL